MELPSELPAAFQRWDDATWYHRFWLMTVLRFEFSYHSQTSSIVPPLIPNSKVLRQRPTSPIDLCSDRLQAIAHVNSWHSAGGPAARPWLPERADCDSYYVIPSSRRPNQRRRIKSPATVMNVNVTTPSATEAITVAYNSGRLRLAVLR
jgi:hypothetical protein